MKQQVPLVSCSRCPKRWPLGGVVDAVHPVSGEHLPDHPMLLVLADRKVACYECVLKHGLRATPLTAKAYEALKERPARTVSPVRVVSEPARPNAYRGPVVERNEHKAPTTSEPAIRVVLTPKDVVALIPVAMPWHAEEPKSLNNPVLTSSLSQRIREDMRQAEATAAARREALVNAELEREATAPWRAGKRVSDVLVTKGRMARTFPRPALGGHWPLPEAKPFETVAMGTATSAFVPEEVLAQVLGASEDTALELRVKGLRVDEKKRSARR